MKPLISIFNSLIIIILFSACSKHDSEISNNLKIVKFKAVGYSQSIRDFNNSSLKGSSAEGDLAKSAKLISHLHFVIFNSQGKVMQVVDQDTVKTASFGEAEIRLPMGSYRIAVAGSSDYGKFPFGDHRMSFVDLDNFKIDFWTELATGSNGIKETFCSDLISFEVTGSSSVSKELILKRVSSQLDIVFENIMPENIRNIILEIPSRTDYYFFFQNPENVKLNYNRDLYGLRGKTGAKLSLPIFVGSVGVNTPKTLKMMFYDQNGSLFLTRTVENIKFEKNKITQVKGNMFGNANPVTVNIGSEFDGKISYTF